MKYGQLITIRQGIPMSGPDKRETGWKQKIIREMIEYWLNVLYLASFLGLFTWYRRLILVQYQIAYLNYGVSIIEALILAKVIMVGDALRLGKRLFASKPLIFPTLYRAVVFGILVGVFKIVERTLSGLLYGKGIAGGFNELISKGGYELLAGSLVTFFAFVPFFAFKELGGVLGKGKISELFFRNRAA